MTVKERLIAFMKSKKLTHRAFADSVGLSSGFVGAISKGIGSEILHRISLQYPDLNTAWLILGDGDMLKEPVNPDALAEVMLVKRDMEARGLLKPSGVPYYENVEATCGIVPQSNDYPEVPAFYINYEHFNDCTAYVPVVGDSMFPQYCSGEIIAVKQILNMGIIQWGEAYFVCTNDDANSLKTIKLIHPHDDDSKIILRASNPNYKGDTVIDKVDIVSLFVIKGKIKRNQL